MGKHPPDPGYYRVKRSRKGRTHINNCKTGYYRDTGRYCQVHHIVPIASVQDCYIRDQLKNDDNFITVKKSLSYTKWDINAEHNCIGLPTRWAFIGRNPKKWGGLPYHLCDHNHYDKKLPVDLKNKVWNTALRRAKKCEIRYQDIKKELEDRSDNWRAFIMQRGRSNKGTKYCWRNRHNMPHTWYYPFSMHPGTPTPRKPAPSWDQFSDDLKEALKSHFKSL